MLLYSTLLCKKIARAPGGHKKFMLTKVGGQNRIDPKIVMDSRPISYLAMQAIISRKLLTGQVNIVETVSKTGKTTL